ncbi:MAG: hypothetical protein J7E07_14310 [Escherichia coli]|nr:hypothetical protein [Escherichia coli]
MIKLVKKIEDTANKAVIALRTKAMVKKPGDGHYVAIAIGLLLALAIGGIVWAVVGGDSGMVKTWITSITNKVTTFINKITT